MAAVNASVSCLSVCCAVAVCEERRLAPSLLSAAEMCMHGGTATIFNSSVIKYKMESASSYYVSPLISTVQKF